jgi:hypothetical protein
MDETSSARIKMPEPDEEIAHKFHTLKLIHDIDEAS